MGEYVSTNSRTVNVIASPVVTPQDRLSAGFASPVCTTAPGNGTLFLFDVTGYSQ